MNDVIIVLKQEMLIWAHIAREYNIKLSSQLVFVKLINFIPFFRLMNQDQCVTSILCYTRAKTNNVEKKKHHKVSQVCCAGRDYNTQCGDRLVFQG